MLLLLLAACTPSDPTDSAADDPSAPTTTPSTTTTTPTPTPTPTTTDSGTVPDTICADEPGAFPDQWIRGGPDCGDEPDLQVHRYSDGVFILRQSLCTSFEAPFLYLIFGAD